MYLKMVQETKQTILNLRITLITAKARSLFSSSLKRFVVGKTKSDRKNYQKVTI